MAYVLLFSTNELSAKPAANNTPSCFPHSYIRNSNSKEANKALLKASISHFSSTLALYKQETSMLQ